MLCTFPDAAFDFQATMNMLKGNQSKQRSRKTEEMEGEIEGKGNLPFAESAERAQRLEDQRFPSPKSESLQVKLANSHKIKSA